MLYNITCYARRGMGAQIGSRLADVFLDIGITSTKTSAKPKLVDQLPSAAAAQPQVSIVNCTASICARRRMIDMILCRQSRLNPPTRTQSLKMPTPEFEKMQASARATRSFR